MTAVAKLPAAPAMRENAEGKKLYRQERWSEARGKYRAALAADPDFLGAQLNIACSLSREGRYAQAADEAIALVRKAYVPWQREVREAADLGVLQDQKEWARVKDAMSKAAGEWGSQVGQGLLFVARTKPPVTVSGQGVLVLRRNQEIFSWNPETGRYFQVTAEDGRVLGFVRSADGRRLVYVLGGKLVREHGRPEILREISLRVLDIASMTLGPQVSIPEDATRIELAFAATPELVVTKPTGQSASYRLEDAGLREIGSRGKPAGEDALAIAGGMGALSGARHVKRAGCRFEVVTEQSSDGLWRVEIRSRAGGRSNFTLDARYGAGVPGLPFVDGRARSKDAARAAQHDKK
jgi:PAS domain-containing protein